MNSNLLISFTNQFPDELTFVQLTFVHAIFEFNVSCPGIVVLPFVSNNVNLRRVFV